ncbi:MAG: hypothetical protein WCI56_03765 [Hyphomicrobiales bacterium]
MRFCKFLTGLAAVSAYILLAAAPADAQSVNITPSPRPVAKPKPEPKRYAVLPGSTVFYSRDENGRRRTKIILQKRSYLDGGTEVLPGERKYTDYVYGPNYSVTGVIDNTAFSHRSPLPGPFEMSSKNSPFGW